MIARLTKILLSTLEKHSCDKPENEQPDVESAGADKQLHGVRELRRNAHKHTQL